jgi:hypothetical protein
MLGPRYAEALSDVTCAAFAPGGTVFGTSSDDGSCRLQDARCPHMLSQFHSPEMVCGVPTLDFSEVSCQPQLWRVLSHVCTLVCVSVELRDRQVTGQFKEVGEEGSTCARTRAHTAGLLCPCLASPLPPPPPPPTAHTHFLPSHLFSSSLPFFVVDLRAEWPVLVFWA